MIVIYDPKPPRHDYLSPMYFAPMRAYASRNRIPLSDAVVLSDINNSTVCCLADYLEPHVVSQLKNNGNKIVGFSVTDSSYVSQCCRAGKDLINIDLMFMLTGIQKINEGSEMVVDKDYKIQLEKRQFLPEEDWAVFHMMDTAGRLQSLPYVHAERQPHVASQPYYARSQKALIRGGHHMRRFILALKLIRFDRLDINSGFVTFPYFQDSMNPQFRYCDSCRDKWKQQRRYSFDGKLGKKGQCTNTAFNVDPIDLSDLGSWNNKCPESFFAVASEFNVPMEQVERLLNGEWLPQQRHLEMLARITFTSDLKWLFSIYAAQRFWDAAMVGCINVLPSRTSDQKYFPVMNPFEHYRIFREDMRLLPMEFEIDERTYNQTAQAAKSLYDEWMRPTEYHINTNLLRHIFSKILEL